MFKWWVLAERRVKSYNGNIHPRFLIFGKHIFWPWLQPQHQTVSQNSPKQGLFTPATTSKSLRRENEPLRSHLKSTAVQRIQSHYNWKNRREFVRKHTHGGGTRTHCVNLTIMQNLSLYWKVNLGNIWYIKLSYCGTQALTWLLDFGCRLVWSIL